MHGGQGALQFLRALRQSTEECLHCAVQGRRQTHSPPPQVSCQALDHRALASQLKQTKQGLFSYPSSSVRHMYRPGAVCTCTCSALLLSGYTTAPPRSLLRYCFGLVPHIPVLATPNVSKAYLSRLSSFGSTNASDPTSSKIKKSRGKFKGLETLKKMRGYNNAKLHVQIDMEFRRPFGENIDDLVGEIARLVTLCASFDVPYRRDVPKDRKTKIYEKLLDKIELRVGDEVCNDIHIRKIIYEIVGRRYRDVRSTLYHHYQSYATDEDRLQNPPEDINANELAWLVNYFGSQNFKAMSERNKVNHSKQVISHITGRRLFKQVSWEEVFCIAGDSTSLEEIVRSDSEQGELIFVERST
ncbi:hypothetical protein Taro_018756, partial [Colocasia esculenta]|nr:hypothetical protein [Colocasia esculenta]